MTGPEHFKRAQTLVVNAWATMSLDGITPLRTPEQRDAMIASAAVHAQLADTAAKIEAAGLDKPGVLGVRSAWDRAVSGGAP